MGQFHVAGYSLGARVALELATRGRTHSVIAIAPDGLGTPLERVHQAAALLSGRALATLLAPIATPVAATGAGRSLFFAMERSRPWQLPAADARQLLLGFAQAPGYHGTVHAAMFDVPTRLERRLTKTAPDQRKRWSLRFDLPAQSDAFRWDEVLRALPLLSRNTASEQPLCDMTVVPMALMVGCTALSERIPELGPSGRLKIQGDA